MTVFGRHFFFSSLLLVFPAFLFLLLKRLTAGRISSQMQYRLWYLFLAFLAVPFLPLNFPGLSGLFPASALSRLSSGASSLSDTISAVSSGRSWLRDFSVSVNRSTPDVLWTVLGGLWLSGVLVMLLSALRSFWRLARLRSSALPLENPAIRELYRECLEESGISFPLPVSTTPYLDSPVLTGFFRPCILLPLSLVSRCPAPSLRHILLHELAHYRRRDNRTAPLMILAGALYWFHPVIRLALKNMRQERESACDSLVLDLLAPEEYAAYGHTLLNFAREDAFSSFASGLGGTAKELKKRLLGILSYRPVTRKIRSRSSLVFLLTLILFLGFSPALAFSPPETDSSWEPSLEHVIQTDFSGYFPEAEGTDSSFVLWNLEENTWTVSGWEDASRRVSPDSTYKIFSALTALEAGVLTPESTRISWNQEEQPFPEWNQDQTLSTAMRYSVNWYFQELDSRTGARTLQKAMQTMSYGNQDISGGLSSFWLESSLQISPLEQVRFLGNLCQNRFSLEDSHIQTVKDALLLEESPNGRLYGKTGTGQTDGHFVNGWFTGFVETDTGTWCFASHIRGTDGADGETAAQCALDILAALGLWC